MPVEEKRIESSGPSPRVRPPCDGASAALLDWYDAHARALPWRVPPGSARRPDPYHVWLSEVMLQQTTVAAVKPYFERFLARWPNVAALADAPGEEVMAAWAGLGYYARARHLHACAHVVAHEHGGQFPNDEAGLRRLPGIGAYSAAAIAAIAFGRRAVVVDANVERVAARMAAIALALPQARPAIRDMVDAMTPPGADEGGRAGDFAQAMMDLGATICTVRVPQCAACPLARWCEAAARGIAETLPRKAPKKAKPQRHGWVFWIERDGQLLIERRAAKGMLGGMAGLPGSDWVDAADALSLAPGMTDTGLSVQHGFTHFGLKLRLARASAPELEEDRGAWIKLQNWREAGLPTLYKKVVLMMESHLLGEAV